MPSPERIEQLHEQLVPLGDEPAVAAERGEAIEPPRRPENNLDDDLSALLADADADSESFAAASDEGEDTAALLSDLDSVFADDEEEGDGATPDEDDPFAGIDLGDDDIAAPSDFSFDPDAIEPAGDELQDTDGAISPEEEPVVDNDTDDILSAFGDDAAADPFADLAALDEDADEGSDLGDLDTDADGADDPGDLGDLGDLSDLDTDADSADDPGDLGDLGDFGDLDTDTDSADDPGELGDMGDLDTDADGDTDLGDFGDLDTDTDGDADLDDLGDLGDLGDLDTDTDGDADLDDLGDLGDLSDLDTDAGGDTDLDDLGDLGDLGDFGDLDTDTDGDADLEDLDTDEETDTGLELETDETEGTEELSADFDDLDEFSMDDFTDLGGDDLDGDDLGGDLGEISTDVDFEEDETGSESEDLDEAEDLADADFAAATEAQEDDDEFGADFGDQVAADFGDIDLNDEALSDDPLADMDDDAFELPAVDDELDSLDEEGFSLGDFGEEFDINEESIDEFAGLDIDTGGIEFGDTDESEGETRETLEEAGPPPERELTDQEFRHLQQTLGSLPLNVKIPTEEIISEGKGSAERTSELIDLLIQGAPPTEIAEHISKILDKKIIVPKGYQKRTGVAFEEEKQSFAYQFTHVIFPVIRIAVVISIIAAIVGFLAYRFVYQPIYAALLYRQGYELAEGDRYEDANETFRRAYDMRPRDRWFVEYAKLFVEKYQYGLAVEKYDQLVFGMDPAVRASRIEAVRNRELGTAYPYNERGDTITLYELLNVDKEAILDHAELQSATLANYARADELYSIILHENEFDYEGLLARGDNYMRWAEQNTEYYERARLTYASMLRQYGDTDEILMRFLRYFIRTENEEQVRNIVRIYQETSPEVPVHPVIFAEAAGFLLDRGEIVGIRDMLFRAYDEDPAVPEIHYEIARYARNTGAYEEERQALDNAISSFAAAEPLSRRRLTKQIDTFIRSGEYWYQRDQILRAQEEYDKARLRYEDGKETAFLQADADLARLYAEIGDIFYYYGRQYEQALDRYDRAAADGYLTDELDYKRGYIHYRAGRYDAANELFFDIGAANEFDGPDNVIYARGNTLYQRGNYVAAEALYEEFLDRLQTERSRITTLLVDEDTTHRSVVENLVRVRNNLGVTRYRIGERLSASSAENPNLGNALADLQVSTELSSNYLRDYETGERALATDLAFLNIREILYPEEGGFEPQIYEELPRDTTQELW